MGRFGPALVIFATPSIRLGNLRFLNACRLRRPWLQAIRADQPTNKVVQARCRHQFRFSTCTPRPNDWQHHAGVNRIPVLDDCRVPAPATCGLNFVHGSGRARQGGHDAGSAATSRGFQHEKPVRQRERLRRAVDHVCSLLLPRRTDDSFCLLPTDQQPQSQGSQNQ